MKTAMQELINEIYKRPTEISQFNAVMLLELIEPLLEKEKEQIMNAVSYGCSDWGSSKDEEKYYNQTYNNGKE
jgi:hypothetical protein